MEKIFANLSFEEGPVYRILKEAQKFNIKNTYTAIGKQPYSIKGYFHEKHIWMENKRKKICLTSLATHETQNKTIRRYHYILIIATRGKKVTMPNPGKDVEKLEHSCFAGGNTELYMDPGKLFCSFLKK